MAARQTPLRHETVADGLVELARLVSPRSGRNELARGAFYVDVDPRSELWTPSSISTHGIVTEDARATLIIAPGNIYRQPTSHFLNILVLERRLTRPEAPQSQQQSYELTGAVVSLGGVMRALRYCREAHLQHAVDTDENTAPIYQETSTSQPLDQATFERFVQNARHILQIT